VGQLVVTIAFRERESLDTEGTKSFYSRISSHLKAVADLLLVRSGVNVGTIPVSGKIGPVGGRLHLQGSRD